MSDILSNIKNIQNSFDIDIKKVSNPHEYETLKKWIIGGPNIVDQLFDLIDTFYLTRIYGQFNCDKQLNLQKIQKYMKLDKKIKSNDSCHFEVWKR